MVKGFFPVAKFDLFDVHNLKFISQDNNDLSVIPGFLIYVNIFT